ncbi:hypothetical protein EDD80_101391 [Anseongella ginsenosidimutans]|uniref:PpiC domain-containing protein n=1 Tax=Anseongella ginsenosidimutans TaxID=496056 RepID=A0A4R3L1A8_9SPHI|nr:hypothetical protein [Anseongella ginsenosidimutans]QEC51138.1 hypothetical protein FRZ59_01415 [Anseongella ginsenosidimutans]TCS90192.1 hypothetical protein EDD80_101391 [Anseongella ginsenosidimutans]
MRNVCSWAFLVVIVSCSSARKEELPVARVYQEYLYPSDLEGVVPADVKGADSVQIIRSYIDNWVRQAVILHKAEQNIAVNEMDFQKQVADYKNSLMIYYYEQALVNEQLDTLITENEARAYYDENKENFLLSRDVYRVAYAELAANAPDLLDIKEKLLDPSPETISELTRYCLLHARSFSFADTSWYSFRELSAFLPADSVGEMNVSPGRVFEIKNKNTVFLIAFRELRKKDSISPYGMERQNIRHLILNQRRLDLLSEMENEVFNEALQNNEFEIYSNE